MRSALLLALFLSQSMAAEPPPSTIPWKRPERWEGALDKPKPKPAAVKNGDFSAATADKKPEGWESAYPTGAFSVVKEGNESFLRVEVKGDPANAGVKQVVPVPPGSITAVVRGRMRGKPGKTPNAAAQLVFWPKAVENPPNPKAPRPKVTVTAPTIITSEHSAGWKTETREIPLLPTVKTFEVSARCVFATGRFDFDDIEVHFK